MSLEGEGKMSKKMVFVLGVLVFLQAMVAAREGASFKRLEILPGSSNSYARDVSQDGSVVVGLGR